MIFNSTMNVMSRPPSLTELTVVSYFVQPRDTDGMVVSKLDPLYTQTPASMLYWLARSVRHHYPRANLVLLTDEHTEIDAGAWTVVRNPRGDDHRLAIHRRMSEAKFLHTKHGNFLLCDPDVLVQRPIDLHFLAPADVIVSWQNRPKWPINLGVVLVNNPIMGSALLHDIADITATLPYEQQRWMGDQDVINEMLLGRFVSAAEPIHWNGIRIWPMSKYQINHSPKRSETPERASAATRAASILHFKGGRKDLMPLYLEEIVRG